MIENRELYQFDETLEMNEPSPVETELGLASKSRFNKFSGRVGVSFCCLLLLLYITKHPAKWAHWVKLRLHTAINATTGQTFGRLIKSSVVSSIMANSHNLIRLENVNQQLTKAMNQARTQASLPGWVWPVNGKLTKGFGWYQAPDSPKPQFSQGIEIVGLPGAKVVAVQSGKVSQVYQEAGSGWTLVLDHGRGYCSVYRNLGQVLVNFSQKVHTGEQLAKLKTTPESADLVIKLEVYEEGRPVDPLSFLPQN
ncbi:MAG TPA: M23 family metallopeptidase [Bacillota bacterium]